MAINIVDNDRIINKFPIIYFWDGTNSINDIFSEQVFIDKLQKNLTYKDYLTTKIYVTYVYTSEEDINNVQREFDVQDYVKLNDKDLEKFIFDVLSFLYNCVFKSYPLANNSIAVIYNKIKDKYPHKINKNIVKNFVKTKLTELYPNIKEETLNMILIKYNDILKDER